MNDEIQIAYALDDNFTEMTCVSMTSILVNTDRTCHFHVVESRLSETCKRVLADIKKQYPHGAWSFHHVQANEIFNTLSLGIHFTAESYYRLLLPELLPGLNKIIYLDGDTIIEKDISSLWDLDLEDKLVGAVPDQQDIIALNKSMLAMQENDLYFNAGVMVLNLEALRQTQFIKEAVRLIPELFQNFSANRITWYADQEILNYWLRDKVKLFPPKYNYQSRYIYNITHDYFTLTEWSEAISEPVIIHYSGAGKPTKISRVLMKSPLWKRYYNYKRLTSYFDPEDENKVGKYLECEGLLGRVLLVSPRVSLSYERYNIFMGWADRIRQEAAGKKLAIWGKNIYTRWLLAILASRDIYFDVIVDGLAKNQGAKIFDRLVQTQDILAANPQDYYVLLAMQAPQAAKAVAQQLAAYGFREGQYHHIHAPFWNALLL
jgi:lipopolysaccharide biosynthesis glycosyltransferase